MIHFPIFPALSFSDHISAYSVLSISFSSTDFCWHLCISRPSSLWQDYFSLPISIPPTFSPYFHAIWLIPALALSACLNLTNTLHTTLPLLIYKGLFRPWGKEFLWYSKGSNWAQKPWAAFVWCGQFYSHSVAWLFKQLQISELKTSEPVHPRVPESARDSSASIFNNLSCISLNSGHIISQALSSYWKVNFANLRMESSMDI